ncbi:MAG: hypothetical protein DIU84_09965, partial [Bacillota bacterium]
MLGLEPGPYAVPFRRFGYGTWVESGLVVAEGEEARLDVRLEVLPLAVISGTVTDAASGAPVAATVMVLDAPLEPAASDPDTGAYRLTVPVGTYTLRVQARGYRTQALEVTAAGDTVVDIAMVPLDMTVLLVDDTGTHPYDARPHYEAALEALGVPYDLFEVPVDEDGPSAQQMAGYDVVVWFTGGSFIGAGPSERDEEELAAYLDDGGSLLLISQDYTYSRGLTPFGRAYLGMAGYVADTASTAVWGVPGHPVGGAFPDPLELVYPWGFTNYNDTLVAADHARPALVGDMAAAGIALTVDGFIFKTAFLGFPWEVIADEEAREAMMLGFLDWLVDKGDTGAVTGTVTDVNDGGPVEGAVVTAYREGEPLARAAAGAAGRYRLVLPLGRYVLEVSAPGYAPERVDLDLTSDGQELQLDFALRTGVARVEPESLVLQADEGGTAEAAVTLSNDGTWGMDWSLLVRTAADPGVTAGVRQPVLDRNPRHDPDPPTPQGRDQGGGPEKPPPAAAPGHPPWPTGLAAPWGVGFDGEVLISNPAALGGDDFNYRFSAGGQVRDRWTTAGVGDWAADMAYDSRHDLIWQVAVGGDNCLYGLDPVDGSVREKICGRPWHFIS